MLLKAIGGREPTPTLNSRRDLSRLRPDASIDSNPPAHSTYRLAGLFRRPLIL